MKGLIFQIETKKGIISATLGEEILPNLICFYSLVSNRRGVWNKRGGWKKSQNLISGGVGIKMSWVENFGKVG